MNSLILLQRLHNLNAYDAKKQRFLISIISLGTLLEWAEYTFYGYMAVTLSTLFFPEKDPRAILGTFGIFAAGYLMRPLGAIFFGHIGDRYGRKPALIGSMLLMGVTTFAIGCLPTYQTIGIAAPTLLLILRMLQGIAISGEYNGAGIFLTEKAEANKQCLTGSWVSAAAAWGMVAGGIAGYLISLPGAPSWSWRLPFLLGGVICILAFRIRYRLSESALFVDSKARKATLPLLESIKKHKRALVFTGAIAAFTGIYVYTANIYIVVFLKQQVHLPTHHATFFAIFGEILVALLTPFWGFVADKTDPYKLYRLGLILVIVFCPFMFILAYTGNYAAILLAMILYGVSNAILCGPMVKILFDQFPPDLRYTGVSFGWSVSAAIFSGTAPLVAELLTNKMNWILGPSFYVCLFALITFIFSKTLSPKVKHEAPYMPRLRKGEIH